MNNNNFFDNTDNSCNRCHQNNCNTPTPGCTICPPDNSATVAPGTDVSFPQDGPNSGTTITPLAGGTRPVSAHLTIMRIM